MDKIFTHKELCEIAENWLRKTLKCTIAIREPSSIKENPDAIGWKYTYGNGVKEGSILVECKTSRSDFKKDSSKLFRQKPELGMGNWRYFLCPTDLIKEDELPEKWGLLYIDDKGKIKAIKHPYIKDTKNSKFNNINEKSEIFILTRWMEKIEEPEKYVYIIRETNNKYNKLQKLYQDLKLQNLELKRQNKLLLE